MSEFSSLVIMIMSGPDDGKTVLLSRESGDGLLDTDGTWSLVLGRREECDVSIPFDTQVSRRHALLRVSTSGELWLVDSGSLNGSFVDGKRIDEPTTITPGQLFRLGRTWMRVQPGGEGA